VIKIILDLGPNQIRIGCQNSFFRIIGFKFLWVTFSCISLTLCNQYLGALTWSGQKGLDSNKKQSVFFSTAYEVFPWFLQIVKGFDSFIYKVANTLKRDLTMDRFHQYFFTQLFCLTVDCVTLFHHLGFYILRLYLPHFLISSFSKKLHAQT